MKYDSMPMPFKYVDSIEEKQHIVLFYEEPEYARLIEFCFIKNGLMRGEQCLYATDEDSGSIVLKFLSYGIPLDYFVTRKLRVIQLRETLGGREQILAKSKKDLDDMLCGLLPPFRIVARMIPDVSTVDGILAELELEKSAQHHFDDLCGSIMYPYDLSKIEKTNKKEWLEELRSSHHVSIYAPRFGEGGVFCCC